MNSEACIDRISNLPSDIIAHILSFLETKEVFATSVLSTRWKHSWTLVPCLTLDDYFFPSKECFISVVDRVLSLHTTLRCLRTLNLYGHDKDYDFSRLRTWFSAALMCNAETLRFVVAIAEEEEEDTSSEVVFLDTLSCQKVAELSLGSNFVMDIPTLVCLTNLKVLRIDGLAFVDDDSIKRLLQGCPILEELRICTGWAHILNISSPVLKKLEVYLDYPNHKIILDAPALQYLYLTGLAPDCCVTNDLNQLVEARLCTFKFKPLTDVEFQALTDFLCGMLHVQTLELTFEFIEAIFMRGSATLPKFKNMTCLTLTHMTDYNLVWEVLPDLLENSPFLEKLAFTSLLGEDFNDFPQNPINWIVPRHMPSCLRYHLKHIEMENFQGSKQENKIADYFIENGEALEEITFSSKLDSEKRIVHGKGRLARKTSDEDM